MNAWLLTALAFVILWVFWQFLQFVFDVLDRRADSKREAVPPNWERE